MVTRRGAMRQHFAIPPPPILHMGATGKERQQKQLERKKAGVRSTIPPVSG